MTALFAGLTTVDILHGLDHTPNPTLKTTSTNFLLAAGGPATNAAVTYAMLSRIAAGKHTHPHPENQAPALLLTALGNGALADVLQTDLHTHAVHTLDATANAATHTPEQATPAISSIIDHPTGRMVASTNGRVPVDSEKARTLLGAQLNRHPHSLRAIMIDGHNPDLAHLTLTWHNLPEEDTAHATVSPENVPTLSPARTSDAPPRILDGGSWKPWLPPLLSHIDIAVISADFTPPLCEGIPCDTPAFGNAVADFLRGFGIHHIIRTRGSDSIQWWWGDASGESPVPHVKATSTLGAGDIFHGAFTWALTHSPTRAGVQLGTSSTCNASTWENITNPARVLNFAAQVAALSTTHFGTRSWMGDPALQTLVDEYLSTTQEAQ